MQHSARFLVLFENSRVVTEGGEIICTGKSSRTASDNGDFFLPAPAVGCHHDFRNEARLGLEVLFRNEFLHGVYGHRLVYGAS